MKISHDQTDCGAQKGVREASKCKMGGWGRARCEIRLQVPEGLVKDFVLGSKHSGCNAYCRLESD